MEKRSKWRFGLPLLAFLALAALLTVPATRWLLRTQMAMAFFPPKEYAWMMQALGVRENMPPVDTISVRERLNAVAAAHRGQYEYELAFAMMMPNPQETQWKSQDVIAALRNLTESYPEEPSLYAHILRFGSMGGLRIGRGEQQAEVADKPPHETYTPQPVDTALLEGYLETAGKGIALEPDNAYFYIMRSILYFGLQQDEEALADIHRAAGCTRFEDYCWQEAEVRFTMEQAAFGEQSMVTELAQSAGILFPHFAQMRASARMAVYNAIEAEKADDIRKGIAIREDVMRVGSLMRREARSYIGTLVGKALVGVGRTRPGGEYLGEETEASNPFQADKTEADKRAEVQAQRKLEKFCAFLNTNNRSDLAEWTRQEFERGETVTEIGKAGLHRSVLQTEQVARLAGLWIANMVILVNAVWMLIFGGLARFLARGKTTPGRGALLLFLGLFGASVYLLVTNLPMTLYFGMLLTMLENLSHEIASLDYSVVLKGIAVLGGLAVPALLLAVSAVVSLVCRVPVSAGILRGFKGVGVPVASLLFLLYGGTLLMTVQEENRGKHNLRQMIQHEGDYLAGLVGRSWPKE